MKNFLLTLAAIVALALPSVVSAQATSVAQSGVSFFTGTPATATSVSGPVRLPTFSGAGTLTITEAGITGSPSGCTFALAYESNNATVATAAVSTTSFTPATGVQQFTVAPSVASGDNYVATYACSVYPTAGSITASFSPVASSSSDPCAKGVKSSASLAIATATTTQVVAVSGTKSIYVCGFNAVFGATTTAQLEYGTSTTCTGTHALTGVMAPGTGVAVAFGNGGATLTSTPAGANGLCVVSTGTGGINGVLTYVQQ
jgi:hypothetical protein